MGSGNSEDYWWETLGRSNDLKPKGPCFASFESKFDFNWKGPAVFYAYNISTNLIYSSVETFIC